MQKQTQKLKCHWRTKIELFICFGLYCILLQLSSQVEFLHPYPSLHMLFQEREKGKIEKEDWEFWPTRRFNQSRTCIKFLLNASILRPLYLFLTFYSSSSSSPSFFLFLSLSLFLFPLPWLMAAKKVQLPAVAVASNTSSVAVAGSTSYSSGRLNHQQQQ